MSPETVSRHFEQIRYFTRIQNVSPVFVKCHFAEKCHAAACVKNNDLVIWHDHEKNEAWYINICGQNNKNKSLRSQHT